MVCDDTKTAVAYFQEMARELKAKVTLKIVRAPFPGATADDVVNNAIKERRGLGQREPRDKVWVLLDLEVQPLCRDRALAAQSKALNNGLCVALSDPCFEIWTLAHLTDTGAAFTNCEAVVAEIKKEWKKAFGVDFGHKKAQADYSKLMPLRGLAISCCRRRHERKDPSWTEVYKVVESIITK